VFEADVTLTDLALAVLCFGLAVTLMLRGGVAVEFALLFGALGLASLLGGLWHGWFSEADSAVSTNLWLATLLSIGLANTMLWLISGRVLASGDYLGVFRWIAALQLIAFVYAAVFVTRDFLLPSAASVPPTLVLLLAFALALAAQGPGGLWYGVAGILVAILGAVLQQTQIGLPALRLSHNGVYHVLQALAFLLLFFSVPAVERFLGVAR